MKVAFDVKGMLLGVSERSYVRKDGTPGRVYDLSLKQGGEIAVLPAVREIYDIYVSKTVDDLSPVLLNCTYDSRWRRFEVIGIHPAK